MLDNVFFTWTFSSETDQLLGIARTNNMIVMDDNDDNKIETKEGLSIGVLICRIDIIF